MHPILASDLLEVWELGAGQTTLEQALLMLGITFPAVSRQRLAELTIAQRDAALFQLRELTFGPQFKSLADCPACREKLELDFNANDLRSLNLLPQNGFELPNFAESQSPAATLSLDLFGYQICFRQPTSVDLMKINLLTDPKEARVRLLNACIVSTIDKKDKPVPVNELPAKVTDAIIEHIGQAATLANLTISATCPACGHKWEIVFDIVSYLWTEINAWAARMMREIHILAVSYGWREADILAMSAWRRQRYLELIGA